MQLHQLRYFVAVSEERHFTRAARLLHVAQPSVSSAIRALERELGASLLHRSRGTVDLTPAGETFLPWARQVLADCEAGEAAVRDALGLRRGRLALGATPSLTTTALPGVLAEYHRRYPGIDLALHEAGSPDLVGRLEQAGLDLALVILPINQSWVRATALYEEELVLAVGPDHPLAGRERVAIGELRDVPLVMFRDGYDLRISTLAACRQAGFQPVLAIDGGEMDGVLAMTAAGLGAAVVPASAVNAQQPGLRAVRFKDAALTRTVGLASRRDRVLPRPAQAFVELLSEHLGPAISPGS
ncbi:MAG: LysR family transcriptional regulator [Acidimicrobiaceae bacterium]|nr:LysR family transcriptional regulator [Acidimicrobiaceae bacterium]